VREKKRLIRDKGKESPERFEQGGMGKRLYRREV
jgi:hypothetical protein